MRRLLTTIILVVSVTLHAALGCCFHHAHPCNSDCCQVPESGDCPCDSHNHGEKQMPSEGQEVDLAHHSHHHGQHDDCEGESCSFPAREASPSFGEENPQDLVCVLDLPAQMLDVTSPARLAGSTPPPNARCPSLRLYILLDILLI